MRPDPPSKRLKSLLLLRLREMLLDQDTVTAVEASARLGVSRRTAERYFRAVHDGLLPLTTSPRFGLWTRAGDGDVARLRARFEAWVAQRSTKESALCSVEGCGNRSEARGLCQMHYRR